MSVAGPIAKVLGDTITKKVVSQLILALGLATIPVIGPVLVGIVTYLADLLFVWALTETVLAGAVVWVAMNVDWSVQDVEKMRDQLKDLLDNPTKYTADQAAEIEKGFDDAAVKLIRLSTVRITF